MQRWLLETDPNFSPPAAEDEPDRKALANVERVGWHVWKIARDESTPQFDYSVGLYYTYGHPEILVMGLPENVAQEFINLAGLRIQGGNGFQAGERTDDLAKGFPFVLLPVSLKHYPEYLGLGIWFYQNLKAPFPVLQLIWPDKQSRFPWEIGYDERFYALQRILSGELPGDNIGQ
jgi:hypothetical protein